MYFGSVFLKNVFSTTSKYLVMSAKQGEVCSSFIILYSLLGHFEIHNMKRHPTSR